MHFLTLKQYITSGGKRKKNWQTVENMPNGDEILRNGQKTVSRTMELLSRIGYLGPLVITSGFRTVDQNKAIGGSPKSHHCFGLAIDLWDPEKLIGAGCLSNIEAMIEIGVWMEALTVTHASPTPEGRWVQWQVVPPKSGNRIFLP